MDEGYSSLLIKDTTNGHYLLRREAKPALNSINTLGSSVQEVQARNHVYFQGSCPQQQNKFVTNNKQTPLRDRLDTTTKQSSILSGMSDFVLLYDDVTRKFRLNQFGGVLKLKKSREAGKFNGIFSKCERGMSEEAVMLESTGKCKSFVDSMIQTIRTEQRFVSPYTESHNGKSGRIRKNESTSEPMKRPTNQNVNRKAKKLKVKPKKSKLLRAAERAVGLSKKARQINQSTYMKFTPQSSKFSHKFSKNSSSFKINEPRRTNRKSIPPTPKKIEKKESDQNILSDQDLADFADELQEELEGNDDVGLPKNNQESPNMNKTEGIQNSDQGHVDDFSDFESDMSDASDMNDSAIDDNNTGEIHVIVDDNPKFMSSMRRLSETVRGQQFDRGTKSSPRPQIASYKKPISLKELATNENLRALKSRSATPSSQSPAMEKSHRIHVNDDTKGAGESDFDEDALDRALDVLEGETSEEE